MERWRRIDGADVEDARAQLALCCGAARWVERMLARRPFGSRDAALSAADDTWFALGPDDWREAFTHHPRIGDVESLRQRYPASGHLSEREQAGLSGTGDDVLAELMERNREYEARFGFIFIVCATGRTASEMLGLLRDRLTNDPGTEIRIAAGEQARITALRLAADTDPAPAPPPATSTPGM